MEQVAGTVPLNCGIEDPATVRVVYVDFPQPVEGFVREDQANQSREYLFREPGEEPRDGAHIQDDQDQHEEGTPQPHPHAELQERDGLMPAELGDELLKYEGGASGAQNHQRLPGENGVEDVTETNC